MSEGVPNPRVSLRVRVDGPATPARVEQVARLYRSIVETLQREGLDPEEITMEVRNLDLKSGLRPWTPKARDLIDEVSAIALSKRRRRPQWAGNIARAFVDFMETIDTTAHLERGKASVSFDPAFKKRMSQLVKSSRATFVRGETSVYSHVLRVGRKDEGAPIRARLVIDGEPADVRVATAMLPLMFEAAKNNSMMMLTLEARWTQGDDGRLKIDSRETTVIAAVVHHEVTSMDLLARLRRAAGFGK